MSKKFIKLHKVSTYFSPAVNSNLDRYEEFCIRKDLITNYGKTSISLTGEKLDEEVCFVEFALNGLLYGYAVKESFEEVDKIMNEEAI